MAAGRAEAAARVDARDLGFHRLKDIEEPEHLYQLTRPGLAEGFPPLKSLGAPSSLPVPTTPLVGREADLDRLLGALADPQVRLVTLTGPGGVGKTRLAIAAAGSLDHAFPHGVYFVALAAVQHPDVMWKTIAGDLGTEGDEAAARHRVPAGPAAPAGPGQPGAATRRGRGHR